jgi:hypothetical protein
MCHGGGSNPSILTLLFITFNSEKKMNTSQLAYELQKTYQRRFRASELNEYAIQLGKIPVNKRPLNNGTCYFLWTENEINILKQLIEQN